MVCIEIVVIFVVVAVAVVLCCSLGNELHIFKCTRHCASTDILFVVKRSFEHG